MIAMGLLYIPFNALGTYEYGKPLYPIIDWSNVPLTLVGWIAVAFVQAGLYYGYVNLHYKWRAHNGHA